MRNCNSREYTRLVCLLDFTADFGVKTKRKVDAKLSAALSEQNWWYSELSVHSNPDYNFTAVCTQ